MKPIYFITSNKNKVREVRAILKRKIIMKNIDIEEIQSLSAEEVVKDKARKAYKIIKKPVIVEDTAYHILSLNSFPGALIKWILTTIGPKGLCKMIPKTNRRVTVKTCFCLYNGKKFHIFTGQVNGKAPLKPQGKSGFGWDPTFIPNGYKKSFAELTAEEKNKISTRKLALEKLEKFLEK